MKQHYIPFVNGIQDADADSSATQGGKLSDALNVCVRPQHLGVLHMRPRFQSKEALVTTNSRAKLCVAGNAPTVVGEFDTYRWLSSGSTYSIDNADASRFRTMTVDVAERIVSRVKKPIMATAYARHTNGDSVSLVSFDSGGGLFSVKYQLSAGGRRYAEQGLYSTGSGQGRVFVFPRFAGAGYISIVNRGIGATNDMRVSTSNDGSFGASIALPGDEIWDAVRVPTTANIFILYELAGVLRVRQITEAGVTVGTDYAVTASVNPQVAGMVYISGASVHVWHGGYGGSDTMFLTMVNSSTGATALGSQASVVMGETIHHITVGGGSMQTDAAGTVGLGSYCHVSTSGDAPGDPRFATLLQASSVAIVESCPAAPILPFGRLWVSTLWFGARVWGRTKLVTGCWEMVPTALASNAQVICRPLCYTTVVNGSNTPESDVADPVRQFSIAMNDAYSDALLLSRHMGSLNHVRLGYETPTRGTTVNGFGLDLMISGVPRYWDGVGFVPAGIPQAPHIEAIIDLFSGTLTPGQYLYAVVWEWNDALGNRQQSPAQIVPFTAGVNGSASILIHPGSLVYDERLLGNPCNMTAVVYRSEVGEEVLKRTTLSLTLDAANLFVSLALTAADDGSYELIDESLYMSPGGDNERESTAMEEIYLARQYGARFVYVSRSFPNQLNYTKTNRVGRGIEPNQNFYFRMTEDAVAIAVQDGNVYWGTANNWYSVFPGFADDTGQGETGVDPVPLCPGIGATSPHVIEAADGVYFLGPRGPWRIPRGGGAPSFIGLDVESKFASYPTCTGVTYNSETSEIIFSMNSGLDHCLMVYNHMLNMWFRWQIGSDGVNFPETGRMTAGIVFAGGELAVGPTCFTSGDHIEIMHMGTYSGTEDQFTFADDLEIFVTIETKDFQPFPSLGESYRADRIALRADTENQVDTEIQISESHNGGFSWSTEYTISTDVSYNDRPTVYRFARQVTGGVRVRLRTTYDSFAVSQKKRASSFAGVTLYATQLGRAKTGTAKQRG